MFKKLAAVVTLSFLLSACSTPKIKNILLDKQFYTDTTKTIGVQVSVADKTKFLIRGADCLLCYGVASAANSTLSNYVETLSTQEFVGFDKELVKIIEERGMKTKLLTDVKYEKLKKLKRIKDPVKEFAEKDYRVLKEKLGVDYLLLVIAFPHVERMYSGYIANGGPTGAVQGEVMIIDLNNNEYKLLQKLTVRNAPIGEWDEPPKFPGVTTSYYTAIEQAKDLVRAFVKAEVNNTTTVTFTNR